MGGRLRLYSLTSFECSKKNGNTLTTPQLYTSKSKISRQGISNHNWNTLFFPCIDAYCLIVTGTLTAFSQMTLLQAISSFSRGQSSCYRLQVITLI